MIHKSSDNVSLIPSLSDASRIVLGDETDAGEFLSEGIFVSMRTRLLGDKLRSIAWTEREVTVSYVISHSLNILNLSHQGIRMGQQVSRVTVYIANDGVA